MKAGSVPPQWSNIETRGRLEKGFSGICGGGAGRVQMGLKIIHFSAAVGFVR